MRPLAQTIRFSSNIASEKMFLKQHSNNCREESVLFWFKNKFSNVCFGITKTLSSRDESLSITASFTWEEAIKVLLCKQL